VFFLWKDQTQIFLEDTISRGHYLKEKHSGGLVGHFGHDNKFVELNNLYYWSGMRMDVKNFVNRCKICQHAKGKRHNT
jgi:hypothetical protein